MNAVVFGVGVVTVGFAVLERSQVRFRFLDNWNPSALPPVTGVDAQRVPLSETILGLVFGTLFLLYWLGVPPLDKIAFSGDGVTVRLVPVWRNFYTPIVMLLLVGIAQNGINMLRPHWTRLRAVTRIVTDASFLVIVYLVLRTRELVIIVDAAGDPGPYADKAQWLSQILAFSLAVTAAVFAVDLIVNLWRLVGRPGANLVTARGTHARL